jgi:hypothetical protein
MLGAVSRMALLEEYHPIFVTPMAGWFGPLSASSFWTPECEQCASGAAAEFGEHSDTIPRAAPPERSPAMVRRGQPDGCRLRISAPLALRPTLA